MILYMKATIPKGFDQQGVCVWGGDGGWKWILYRDMMNFVANMVG